MAEFEIQGNIYDQQIPIEYKDDNITGITFIEEVAPLFHKAFFDKPQITQLAKNFFMGNWSRNKGITANFNMADEKFSYDIEYIAAGKKDKFVKIVKSTVSETNSINDNSRAILYMSTNPTPEELIIAKPVANGFNHFIAYKGPTEAGENETYFNTSEAEHQALKILNEIRDFAPTKITLC